jgi:hypothetical protein
MNWVDINQKEGETYACVNRIDNAWGKGLIELKTIQLPRN